jgi:hypothetical protein
MEPNDTISSDLSNIVSSTRAILFFGVPKNVEDSFGNLGKLALEEGTFSDSALIKALKQDVRWLQVSNLRYASLSGDFKVTYFLESPDDGASKIPNKVRQHDPDSPSVNLLTMFPVTTVSRARTFLFR